MIQDASDDLPPSKARGHYQKGRYHIRKGGGDMAIKVNLDVLMAQKKKGLTELAKEVDITLANLSILKNNKAKAVRFSTLESICKALDCQPGDILIYEDEEDNDE